MPIAASAVVVLSGELLLIRRGCKQPDIGRKPRCNACELGRSDLGPNAKAAERDALCAAST
jgi:hypothetical protein